MNTLNNQHYANFFPELVHQLDTHHEGVTVQFQFVKSNGERRLENAIKLQLEG